MGLKAGGLGEILFMKTLDSRSPTSLCAAFDCAVYTLAVTGGWSLERIGDFWPGEHQLQLNSGVPYEKQGIKSESIH